MPIGLIPLDERPVNTRYPAMIAAIAGADLRQPPRELLSDYRTPADADRLVGWLRETAPQLDALIVSCEMLGYGGLIASRTTADSTEAVLRRLGVLRELKAAHPELFIVGFNLIMRISNSNSGMEEPPYWPRHGKQIYRYSQLLDMLAQGQPVEEELAVLSAELPPEVVRDFLHRRLRNHAVNQAVIHMLAEGVLDQLVLSSDDTSPYGLPSREKRWLTGWADLLGMGDRLLMYPGADEVGCALLARVIHRERGLKPRFAPFYAVPGGEAVVAAYEDGPITLTVNRQIRAVGGDVANDGAFWLAVNPPVPRRSEWHADHAAAERDSRMDHLRRMAAGVRERVEAGGAVVVADVAYPNGADPALIDALLEAGVDLTALAAYGAWNTAGNTIGTALAQACAARLASTEAARAAQERFLLHRFVEDWGYQHVVRRQFVAWLLETYGQDEPPADQLDACTAWLTPRLQAQLDALPGFAGRYRVADVWLPWRRTFEVDFSLEPVAGAGS